ncbi:GGDEF domain-containing protein [Deinococcus ruber]|nr:GGDEF domain-containing protein [Deinococcus ruber]
MLLHRDAAYLALDLGEAASAMTHALTCLELARALNDASLQAKAHVALALVQTDSYDDLGAAEQFRQADLLSRAVGDDRGVALVAVNASHSEMERGEYGAATLRLHDLLTSPQAHSLTLGTSQELNQSFHINYVVSASEALMADTVPPERVQEIARQVQESAQFLKTLDAQRDLLAAPLLILAVLDALMRFAVWQGRMLDALELADERVLLAERVQSGGLLGRALYERSRVYALMRHWQAAISDLEQATEQFEATEQAPLVVRAREALAEAFANTGRFQEAFEAQREVTRRVERLYRAYYQQRALVGQVAQQAREAEVRASALAEAALRDPLTGIPNRTYAMQQLARLHLASDSASAVAFIDLDNFKSVNDRYGHLIGDAVLTRIAQTLSSNIREQDCLARFGGEEFILLFSGLPMAEAVSACDRLRSLLVHLDWQAVVPGLHTTASFGVAALNHSQPLNHTLQAADDALYAAKAAGRNRVCSSDQLWSPDQQQV